MRIFLSAGEPSGDLHGASLVRALRRLQPDVELSGFGGERMADAGCPLLYPLADHPVIGLTAAAASRANGAGRSTRPRASATTTTRRSPS